MTKTKTATPENVIHVTLSATQVRLMQRALDGLLITPSLTEGETYVVKAMRRYLDDRLEHGVWRTE